MKEKKTKSSSQLELLVSLEKRRNVFFTFLNEERERERVREREREL
jgi:hypothetical protein